MNRADALAYESVPGAAATARARHVSAAVDAAVPRPGPRQVHDGRRKSVQDRRARSRSRPSRSTSTPRPIPSCARRSTAMSCRSRRRCGPRRWSTISPTTTRRRDAPTQPFSTNVSVFPSPWSPGRKLVRIGIKGYDDPARDAAARQPRLPDRHVGLDERAEQAAAGQAVADACCSTSSTPDDTVAIVTYAGDAGTALEPTPASREEQDPRRDRPARRRRQHRRRRGHPPGLCAGRSAISIRTASTA